MHREALRQLLAQNLSPKVLVFGELYLRHEVLGIAREIAPEAPVPVLEVLSEEMQLGGAGEVALSLTALGAWSAPVAVVGQDEESRAVRRLLDCSGISSAGLIPDRHHRTRVVMRLLGRSSSPGFAHLLCVQWEGVSAEANASISMAALRKVYPLLEEKAVLLLLPGHEWLLTMEHLQELVDEAGCRGCRLVAALPSKVPWSGYRGAKCVFTHYSTLSELPPDQAAKGEDPVATAARLAKENAFDYLVVWGGPEGMLTSISGVGDSFISQDCPRAGITSDTLAEILTVTAFVYGLGGDWPLAWELFQLIQTMQSVPTSAFAPGRGYKVTRKQLEAALNDTERAGIGKIFSVSEFSHHLARGLLQGKRVVFAGGNFEQLLPSQVAALEWAKSLGDHLIVGIRSDRCLRNARGRAGEGSSQAERAAMVASLDCVDFVVVGEEVSFSDVLHLLRPHVVVKGIESAWEAAIGWQVVELYGGRIVTAPILVSRPHVRIRSEFFGKPVNKEAESQSSDSEPTILAFPTAA